VYYEYIQGDAMCKITRFELDEALERVRKHIPLTADKIEKYVDQLERERRDDIETMRLAGINGIGMVTVQKMTGMEPFHHVNTTARNLSERSK